MVTPSKPIYSSHLPPVPIIVLAAIVAVATLAGAFVVATVWAGVQRQHDAAVACYQSGGSYKWTDDAGHFWDYNRSTGGAFDHLVCVPR